MQDIVNYNCDGLCIQKYCSKKYTKMTNQEINNVDVVLGFCEDHAEEFENSPHQNLKGGAMMKELNKEGSK